MQSCFEVGMKTQKSRLERQIQHSNDLARSRINKQELVLRKTEKWIIVALSLVWVGVVAVAYLLR